MRDAGKVAGALFTIACYNDLVEALRSRKASLGLSDATLDDIAGLTAGHTNKVLGPSRDRGIGAATFEAYLMALAIDLVMVESKSKLKTMRPHYEGRKDSHVRTNHRLSGAGVSRIMSELGRRRQAKYTAEQRSEYARRAAWKRWEKAG